MTTKVMTNNETSEAPAGCTRLIAALNEAVCGDDHTAITKRVEAVLCRLITAGGVRLPEAFCVPITGGYARRLLHDDPARGYTAIAMVWGPGQGTPVHDHNGLWCVEGVVEGAIEITQYDLVARDGVRHRFLRQATIRAGVGSAGRLIPPYDYHTIANPDSDKKAVTIHVYGGEMDRCSAFQPLPDGWYQKEIRQLSYTAA